MSDRLQRSMAAVAAVLVKKDRPRQEILGVVERDKASEADWCCVVLTREFDDEWELYLVWPDGDKEAPADVLDEVELGMVVRHDTNALSHGHALLDLVGLALGVE